MQPKDQTGHSTTPPLPGLAERARAAFEKVPLPALLCVLVSAVFFRTLGNDFVNWDDVQYVLSNPALRGSWLDALGFSPGYYHPLTTLTYKLEYTFFGPNPVLFHFTSLVLHLAVCVSAFYLLAALGARRGSAFLGALLFGIHPVHVEPVAWVSGRKELLWGLFSCWTLLAYLKFADTQRKSCFLYSLGFFFLAVLSKPFAMLLPAVLLLADQYRGRAFNFRLLLEKAPFLAIALPLLTLSTAHSGFLLKTEEGPFSFFRSAAFLVQSAAFYAQKLLLPVKLAVLYPQLQISRAALPCFFLLLFALLAARRLAEPGATAAEPGPVKKAVFGLGFFLVTLAPALAVSPPADRYVYLPALGPCFLYGEFVSWLYGALRGPAGRASLPALALGLAVTAQFIALGAASAQRVPVWKNSFTLWDDELRKHPLEPVAYYSRGSARAAAGEYGEALRDLTRCVELAPGYWKAYNNRGRLFTELKELDKAVADYSAAIAVNPAEPALFLNRGNVYLMKGDRARAGEDYDRALAVAPGFAPALENKKRASADAR